MKDKEKRIIQEIANEEGVKFSQAEECVESQFDFAKSIVSKGEFESVHLPYFGKLWVDPRRVKKVNEKND
jgi:nucleoid DNA-binding protein